jgi:hypothetical protein
MNASVADFGAIEEPVPPRGGMGLSGIWALVGNSTAMVIVAVVLFMAIFQVKAMHNEAMGLFREIHAAEREMNKDNQLEMRRVIEQNTVALKELVIEIRKNK